MKLVLKIVLAGMILLVITIAGCTALVGAGANQAAKAIDKAQAKDTTAARAFKAKWERVRIGNTLTGKGGMTMTQVAAMLGKPKPKNIIRSQTAGLTAVTWSWDFWLSDSSQPSSYSVDFLNGHTSGKAVL